MIERDGLYVLGIIGQWSDYLFILTKLTNDKKNKRVQKYTSYYDLTDFLKINSLLFHHVILKRRTKGIPNTKLIKRTQKINYNLRS